MEEQVRGKAKEEEKVQKEKEEEQVRRKKEEEMIEGKVEKEENARRFVFLVLGRHSQRQVMLCGRKESEGENVEQSRVKKIRWKEKKEKHVEEKEDRGENIDPAKQMEMANNYRMIQRPFIHTYYHT